MAPSQTLPLIVAPSRLIDGAGGPARQGVAVAVEGGRISWVGPEEQVSGPGGPFPGATEGMHYQVQRFRGATLLPGLVDIHTHTTMPGDGRSGEDVDRESDEIRLLRAAQNARRALETGVTTLCDCGAWNHTALSLREGLALGLVDGPQVLVSGRPITCTGGHLWFMGGEADGVDQVRRLARQLLKEGVDFIKVVASGGSTVISDPYRPSLSAAEIKAAVEESHLRDRRVLAHCRSTAAINNCLDAGVDAILHCGFYDADGTFRFDPATARRLEEAGTWVNPTLRIRIAQRDLLRRQREEQGLTAADEALLADLEALCRARLEQCGQLIEAGVNLVGGSDCGWGAYPFGDYQGELAAMVEAGLSPGQAILAGTGDAAAAMGILDQVGTIESGKRANFLLVNGNPDVDIASLRDVAAVFRDGNPVMSVGSG